MFTIRKKLTPQMDIALSVGGMLLVLLVWCIVTYGGYVKPIFLPTPTGILEGFGELHHKGWLIPAILRSTWRVTQALLLVMAVGIPVGLLMGAFPAVDAVLRLLVNGGKSVPTTGIVGLIVLWFSIEEKAKIVFLFLGAIFYMVILVKNAVQSVPEEYIRVAVDIGASPWQMAQRILIPGALPQIWDAIAVCNGIMWTYIVLAEFINSSEESLGLGFLLSTSSRTNEPGQVFAVLIVIAVISSVTDWALQWVRRRYLNW